MGIRRNPSGGTHKSKSPQGVIEGFSDEELAAWRKSFDSTDISDEGKTVSELAAAFGVNACTIQRMLTKGIAAKIYQRGTAVKRDSVGRRIRVPVYSLVKP